MSSARLPKDARGRGVRVKMFGPLEVQDGARRLGPRDFGGVKPKQLLEILLAARGHPVPKDRLGDLLWGEKLPQSVAGALENYVSVLRRALATRGAQGHHLIVTEPDAYRFAVERADVDLDRFDELVERARSVHPSAMRGCLERALLLVRGELFEDEPYSGWAEELRGTYFAAVQQARLDAAEAALADRDFGAALDHAEAALSKDRFDERAYRAAMLALYAAGRQHHALDAFNRCRTALEEELGVQPLDDTRALHTAILRHIDPETLLPRTPSAAAENDGDGVPHAPPTRIERALAAIATTAQSPGIRIGCADCSERERDVLSVLRRALCEAVGTDIGLPAGKAAPVSAVESLVDAIREHAPLALVVEQLQWANARSVAALADLQRRCKGLQVAVIGTFLAQDVTREHPLQRLEPTASIELGGTRAVVLAERPELGLVWLMICATLLGPRFFGLLSPAAPAWEATEAAGSA